MRKLIEKAQEELTRRILAEEYEMISIEQNKSLSYVCDVAFKIDNYRFDYVVAETFICDHSEIQISENRQPIIDHFIKKFNEKFNSDEIKAQRIEELKKQIKDLES